MFWGNILEFKNAEKILTYEAKGTETSTINMIIRKKHFQKRVLYCFTRFVDRVT